MPLPASLLVVVVGTAAGAGCRTAVGPAGGLSAGQLAAASAELGRPLGGDIAALYRLRVAATGGLRLALLTVAGSGQVVISQPFGSAVSLTRWHGAEEPAVYDYREGCRFTSDGLYGALGVATLPMPQAVRLLGGRIPATAGDRVELAGDGRILVRGTGWQGLVSVAPDPWRVTAVADASSSVGGGWSIRVVDHLRAVPSRLRVSGSDGRWAELELTRLEWNTADELPPEPELPPCGTGDGRVALPDG